MHKVIIIRMNSNWGNFIPNFDKKFLWIRDHGQKSAIKYSETNRSIIGQISIGTSTIYTNSNN